MVYVASKDRNLKYKPTGSKHAKHLIELNEEKLERKNPGQIN